MLNELSNLWKAWQAHANPDENKEAKSFLQQYVEIRDKQKLNDLFMEFTQTFGREGEEIAARPSKALAYNGGNNPTDPDKYTPGMHYSLPLMVYVMRRALEKNDPDRAYEKYVKNVEKLVEDENERIRAENANSLDLKPLLEIKQIPTQQFVEKLCAHHITAIQNLKLNPHAQANNTSGVNEHGEMRV